MKVEMAAQEKPPKSTGLQTPSISTTSVPPVVGPETGKGAPQPLSPSLVTPQAPKTNTPIGGTTKQPSPPPKRGFIKKVLKIFGILVGVALLVFLIVRFVLPLFQKTDEGSLTWWGLWEDESIVAPLIQEYEKSTGVKVAYVRQSHKDYRERLTSALARGEGPDLFRFHNSWVPMFREELDQVPASVMSPAEFAETFYPVALSDLSSGTGIVGIPLEYDAITLYINEDIFNEEGKAPPITWDDLRQTALELTRKDDQGVITRAGVALGRTENVDHWQEILALMMVQNGARLSDPTGDLAEGAFTFFTVFSRVDEVWDDTLPSSTVAFAAGKAAMYFGPSWRAFEIAQQNPALSFKTVPLPQLPKEDGQGFDIAYATYWAEGVWSRSPNKEVAWDFLKFLSTKENLQVLYQSAAKTRSFGEPYPRVDMAELLLDHPILGSIIEKAPDAESWYLADRTFDGPTGINTQLALYYGDAINALNLREKIDEVLLIASQGVTQVLTQYGVR